MNVKDGIVKLLKKDYLTHGINVAVDENNEITIDFHVIISYGVSINTIAYLQSFLYERSVSRYYNRFLQKRKLYFYIFEKNEFMPCIHICSSFFLHNGNGI